MLISIPPPLPAAPGRTAGNQEENNISRSNVNHYIGGLPLATAVPPATIAAAEKAQHFTSNSHEPEHFADMISSFVLSDPEATVLTISEAAAAYLRSQARLLSPETIKLYEHALGYLVAFFPADPRVEDIERAHLAEWRDSLFDVTRWENHPTMRKQQGGLSVHTIRRIMGDAATFFNWLVAVGILGSSPMRLVKKPPAPEIGPKAISVADFDSLLDEAGRYRGNKYNLAPAYTSRNQAVLLFMASTGCRVGGLCSARLATLQLGDDSGQVEVLEKGRGGGKRRVVYLSDTAVLALLEWLDYRPLCAHDYIFVGLEGGSAGKRMTTASVRQMLIRLAERAGINGRFNPHSFRHACAREWLRNGADLQTVSQLLGHSDIGVTAKYYALWSKSELRDRHDQIDWTSDNGHE